MTTQERRDQVYQLLSASDEPVSATALARRFGVSRQIIVGDIALLRAGGYQITATPRGYTIPADGGLIRQVACCHSAAETQKELYLMVDCGCTVLDVIVEHPVYGQLTAALQLSSRYDVDQFIEKMAAHDARPLSLLTEGIHLHTLSCPSLEVFQHLEAQLRENHLLPEDQ